MAKTTKAQYVQALRDVGCPAVSDCTPAQAMRSYTYGTLYGWWVEYETGTGWAAKIGA